MADADRLRGEELGQVEGEADGQQEQTRSEQDDAGSKTYRVRDRQEARGATVVRFSADGCESPKVSTP